MFLAVLALAAVARAGLPGDVELALRAAGLGEARIALCITEAGTGEPLVEISADELMTPASNMKLFTTGAALHTLGADFRFKTKLVLEGDRLVIVGDGDPAFGDSVLLETMTAGEDGPGLDVEGFLSLWVDPVVEAGYGNIREVVIDDSIFDREYVHPTWPRDQLNRRYCAQVSGLSFHLNTLHFFPRPRPGSRPSLAIFEPRTTSLRSFSNNATSRDGVHDDNTVWVARKLGTNDLTVYGNVKHAYTMPVPVAMHEMSWIFGDLLADRLRRKGLRVGPARLCDPLETVHTGLTVGPVIYTPIATAITRCNRDSQNLYAESLLKRMGHAKTGQPGSWLNGAAIVRHAVHERLEKVFLASKLIVIDGSGLSRDNRVAPATVCAWLNSFHNDAELGGPFLDSLAVGGVNGTLERRFETGRLEGAIVQAKSGYIDGVSCLSGYVTGPDGARRCFSIMVNDLRVPVRRAKDFQDRIVEAIARELSAAAVPLGSD